MKSTRICLMVFMLLAVLLLATGCDMHYVEVYINDECALVDKDNVVVIDPLKVSVGDKVIFNNMNDDEVLLTFPQGIFEKDEVRIEGGQGETVKVIKATLEEEFIEIDCKKIKGKPKVVVGEDP